MRRKKFYLIRLKNSSIPELIYRVRQAYQVRRLKRLLTKNIVSFQIPQIADVDLESLELPELEGNIDKNEINRILRGKTCCLNPDNHSFKLIEKEYQKVFCSEIRHTDLSQDIRAVWESARLQHITTLLTYTLFNHRDPESARHKQYAKNTVLGWIRENPFLFGLHYLSAMECGLRIPVFFYCLKISGFFSSLEYRSILEAIFLHARWISKRLSLYSSIGNHTIAECVGLIFAGAIFRNSGEGRKWLERGFNLLNQEIDRQILEDGGPAEQSLNYHRFVIDLYWLSIDFVERNKLYNCSGMKKKLLSGEKFLDAFSDSKGTRPSIGDSDDGYAVAPDFFPKRLKSSQESRKYIVFPDSGYTVIRLSRDTIFTFDHGPLGMPPLFNHGHADALSITLMIDGQPILVDPGTFQYNGAPEFRRYFKGTRAHNTVAVDGLDQAVQETSFIWSKAYKNRLVKIKETDGGLLLEAFHNGYSRLKEPVFHKRSIYYFEGGKFIVKDTFWGCGNHDFELNYHLHPEAHTIKKQDWWMIDNYGVKVFLKLVDSSNFLLVDGQEEPRIGWYSPRYGIKQRSEVLRYHKYGSVNQVSFVTAICIESPMENGFMNQRISQRA